MTLRVVYEPKGRAAEYSPLALNPYNGCDHDCSYCYMRESRGPWSCIAVKAAAKFSFDALNKDLSEMHVSGDKRQVLMCFAGDPYCNADVSLGITRECVKAFLKWKHPLAILTKGGTRCLRDLDLFSQFPKGAVKIGATIVFADDSRRKSFERGAASIEDRMEALKVVHDAGIRTWISLEPVIDMEQALAVIEVTHGFVDEYRIGPVNHVSLGVGNDWVLFHDDIVRRLREYGKDYYLKEDLLRRAGRFYKMDPRALDSAFIMEPLPEQKSLF